MKENYPVDTKRTIYIRSGISVVDLLETIRNKFPNSAYTDIDITSESIQVRGCRCHSDWSDYEDFILASI